MPPHQHWRHNRCTTTISCWRAVAPEPSCGQIGNHKSRSTAPVAPVDRPDQPCCPCPGKGSLMCILELGTQQPCRDNVTFFQATQLLVISLLLYSLWLFDTETLTFVKTTFLVPEALHITSARCRCRKAIQLSRAQLWCILHNFVMIITVHCTGVISSAVLGYPMTTGPTTNHITR